MGEAMHISVMIPTFNRAHLIRPTIESILAQSYEDFTLTVVDDGSSDGSVAAINEYVTRDSRVSLVVNERNLGLVRNWNKCLDLAEGPLVQIMQSDDLIDADYFDLVVEKFKQHETLGFVAASPRYIDIDGKVIDGGREREPRYYRAGDEAVMALINEGYPHVSSIIMRRECYEMLGKFNEALWHGPDMEMNARLATRYDFYHFGKIYTSFRRHGTNMGVLEYMRDDFLKVDMEKKRITLGYLSEAGLRAIGIDDIEAYVQHTAAQASISVATALLAYGRPQISRHYILQARTLSPDILQTSRYWRAVVLNLVPLIGIRVMRRRMAITSEDLERSTLIQKSLDELPIPDIN